MFTIAAFRSSPFAFFQPASACLACATSAATPATCGDAIEVPEMIAMPLPVPLPVEMTLTPGAVMSGLRSLVPTVGPPELKLAKPV